jgi:hypothetical protein
MKDLDFDELDRAVNSLMSNVPKSVPQTDDDKINTLDITPTLGDDTKPSFDKIEETAAKVVDDGKSVPEPSLPISEPATKTSVTIPARAQTAAAPATRRGAGKFMDVVHPSTEVKKADLTRPVSRHAATIEPLGSPTQKIADIVPSKKESKDAAASEKPEPKPIDTPVIEAATEPEKMPVPTTPMDDAAELKKPEEKAPEPTTSDWPDPLDMVTTSEPKEVETKASVDAEPEVSDEPKTPEVETSSPLVSPFLADAKVEKRPLGGMTVDDDETAIEEPSRAPATVEEEVKKTVDDPNNQLPVDPSAVDVQLPEELHADLMAVESDTTHADMKREHEIAAESMPVAKEEVTSPVVTKPEAKTPEEPQATGPTSIPQQYREEPSTGDQDNGSIYDTDTYHQPLAHPAQKKSGWMWVIGIVGILLLGAAAGATLYLLKLV